MRDFLPVDEIAVADWHEARGLGRIFHRPVNGIGCIEPGVACGFLHVLDVPVAIFCTFVANPHVPGPQRAAILREVAEWLTLRGKERGVQRFVLRTEHPGIADWALAKGMTHFGEGLFEGAVTALRKEG